MQYQLNEEADENAPNLSRSDSWRRRFEGYIAAKGLAGNVTLMAQWSQAIYLSHGDEKPEEVAAREIQRIFPFFN